MNGEHIQLAHAFIEQYNLAKGIQYEFECLRKRMFSIEKYPGFEEIYEVAFIEGKKRSPIVADFMVLLRLQKRLIIDVVKPRYWEGFVEDTTLLSRGIEAIVDHLERGALSEVVCSKYLLIDNRNFGCVRIGDPESYRKLRLERDKSFERHRSLSLRKADEREFERELSQLGIPTKHWFKEIWLLYHDEKGVVRCLQIW